MSFYDYDKKINLNYDMRNPVLKSIFKTKVELGHYEGPQSILKKAEKDTCTHPLDINESNGHQLENYSTSTFAHSHHEASHGDERSPIKICQKPSTEVPTSSESNEIDNLPSEFHIFF